MAQQTAVVLGGSGLIGSFLIQFLLSDENYLCVRVLLRKEIPVSHPKLQQRIVNFDNVEEIRNNFGTGDAIFSSIGTTLKKVKGDKALYRRIDHDITVNAARIGSELGYKKFLLVSSVGVNPTASNFYLRLKGEIENDVKEFPFESICIFRPSMLLGKREESRPAERIGQSLMSALSFLFIGGLKKYHPVKAEDVAKAMAFAGKTDQKGINIFEYTQLIRLLTIDPMTK